jgi:hypothetical protein
MLRAKLCNALNVHLSPLSRDHAGWLAIYTAPQPLLTLIVNTMLSEMCRGRLNVTFHARVCAKECHHTFHFCRFFILILR